VTALELSIVTDISGGNGRFLGAAAACLEAVVKNEAEVRIGRPSSGTHDGVADGRPRIAIVNCGKIDP
jgi:hypothetical protein